MTAGNLMMTFLESVGADHCILSSPISSLPACEHWLKFKKGYRFFFSFFIMNSRSSADSIVLEWDIVPLAHS